MKQEGLRLMTPDEYLTKLKGEGYDYFLLNDNIYQYEEGKLLHVFGEDVELVISKDINVFKSVEMPKDYLSIVGVTHDFVAFMVAKKAEIIILDDQNVPIAQYDEHFPNVPSAFSSYEYPLGKQQIANMLVRYEAPGYPSEGHLTFDKDTIAKKQSRYHKVIHNGQFFYPGFESKLSLGDFTGSFTYYTGMNYFSETMDFEYYYEEYTALPATQSSESQLMQMFAKMKELFMEMEDWTPGTVPFKNVKVYYRNQPIHIDDQAILETVINMSVIKIADGKYDSDTKGNLYPEGIWFTDLVSDQNLRYPIERVSFILEKNGIVHRSTIDFEDYAKQMLVFMTESNAMFKTVGHTVSVRSDFKEYPLGYQAKERPRQFRTPEDYPEVFGPFVEPTIPENSAFPDPPPTKSVPVSFEWESPF